MDDTAPVASRAWHAWLYALLVFVFVAGGSSQVRDLTDAIAQLLSLPVIAIALWKIQALPPSMVRRLALVAVAAVVLLPWLQLLPLSQPLWLLAPARQALERDLIEMGVAAHASTWSLTPAGTLRGAFSLLPPVALFLAVLSADATTQRRLLVLCVALPVASLILGFLQLGAAQDSLLNPYPQWAPAMGGVFANPNHQGTAMLVGLGICMAFAVDGFRSRPEGGRNPWPAVIAGGTLLLALPLTNSRATALIGVLLVAGAPLAMSATLLRRTGQGRRSLFVLLAGAVVAAIGLGLAMGWMRVDELEGARSLIRRATFALAMEHLPWGSGIGSFVPVFEQGMPLELLLPSYINAAHNDYAQLWLEAGIPGLLVAGMAFGALAFAMRAHFHGQAGDRRLVWSAVFGIAVFLAHSVVDYPLRTPALMTVFALLAGILVAQGARNR